MKKLFCLLCFLICCHPGIAEEYEYGLRIVTYPSAPEKFTSLSLDEGKLIPAKKSQFRMAFEMMNRHDNVFGCIFRLITDDGYNVDLMYTADKEDRRYPILVCGSEVTDIPSEIAMDRWIGVSITLNPKTGDISLDYNGTEISVQKEEVKGAAGFRIAFGLCRFAGYSLDDVASVDLRNIEIFRGNRNIHRWPLSRHDGNCCTDETDGAPAIAVNPLWILDQYITWDEVLTLAYDKEPSIAAGSNGEVYITTDGRNLEIYDTENLSATKIAGIGGITPINAPDQLLFTGSDIFAYNVDDASFSRLDRERKIWKGGGKFTPESHYWNKTSVWWAERKALVSFGGYGFYHYNNELMIQYPYSDRDNVKVVLEDIHPRYSAASAITDSTLYIFGGRGNPSGKQELSPRKYYDLYAVNLKTFKVEKLWEFDEEPEFEFVPSGNMVYDKNQDSFYVFTNLEGGTLISIKKESPGFEMMSLPAASFHNAQYSFFNLWTGKDGTKLYGLMEQSQVDGRSTVNIMSINYPPINVNSLRQNAVGENTDKGGSGSAKSFWWWAVLIVAAASAATAWLIGMHHRPGKKEKDETQPSGSNGQTVDKFYDFSRSSIRFFGGFCVMDKEGNNITGQFTPTLKALTVLLILHSCKDTNGIISNKLNRTLWPYKPEDTANNNRNVYISKLRPLLESVGDISVACQNRFWSIHFGKDTICDYVEAQRLLNESTTEDGIAHLLELLLCGMMLPNMEQEWVDEFKSSFSSLTIDFLSRQLGRKDLSHSTLICICDSIFQHDFLNEDALKVKCSILYGQGKVGLAKSVYDSFCKEYKSSLGMEYRASFKQTVA